MAETEYIFAPGPQVMAGIAENKGCLMDFVQVIGRQNTYRGPVVELAHKTKGYLGTVPASAVVSVPGGKITVSIEIQLLERALQRKLARNGRLYSMRYKETARTIPIDNPQDNPRPVAVDDGRRSPHKVQPKSIGSSMLREGAALAAFKEYASGKLGKRQIKQNARKPSVIGDDVANAHRMAVLSELRAKIAELDAQAKRLA